MEQFGFDDLPDAVRSILDKVERIEKLLLGQQSPESRTQKMLTIKEAAKFLNTTVSALYSLVSRKAIPVNKPGKRLYFDKEELTEWIREGKQKTGTEIEKEVLKHTTRKYRFNR